MEDIDVKIPLLTLVDVGELPVPEEEFRMPLSELVGDGALLLNGPIEYEYGRLVKIPEIDRPVLRGMMMELLAPVVPMLGNDELIVG